ncbi:unnamed protein product [Danaus chrysippus]|uniref:(African queen) hypothetical protein n=1 Tax=Danaus chrysippus TaxID=151541 RepID=A0A8J2RBZ5_9NEOP|nr:unnamed protein product [Danaus chrysippus]
MFLIWSVMRRSWIYSMKTLLPQYKQGVSKSLSTGSANPCSGTINHRLKRIGTVQLYFHVSLALQARVDPSIIHHTILSLVQ